MTKDEMPFLDTQRIVRPLTRTCDDTWRGQREKVRVCAYGEVLSVHGTGDRMVNEKTYLDDKA